MILRKLIAFILTCFFLISCGNEITGEIEVSNIVNPDEIAPSIQFITTPTTINGAQDFTIQYNLTDEGSGVSTAHLLYTADVDNVAFSSVGNLPAGLNKSATFCVPNKSHLKLSLQIRMEIQHKKLLVTSQLKTLRYLYPLIQQLLQ